MSAGRRRPLKLKLVFFATALVVFVAASFNYYLRRGQRVAIIDSQQVARQDTVKALRQVAREAILVEDDTNMVNYVNLLKRSITTVYAMVLFEDGRVRVHTDPLMIGKKLEDEASQKTLSQGISQNVFIQDLTMPDGREVLDMSIPITIGLNPAEYKGVARIGFDKAAIEEDIARSLRDADRQRNTAFALGVGLGVAGAFILAAFITRPLKTLSDGARRIGEGQLDHRISVQTRDELEDLANEFNVMARKLGELDRMKQDFVSNVTHELRSPMTSIRGYIDFFLNGTAGPITELQKDYLTIIKNNAVRLGRFIDNLLDVAKIEAHKLKLTPEPLNLWDLAHEMEVLFKPQAGEKRIRLVNAVPKGATPAFVDKDKMAEVLINLTSNAIKFTPEDGEVKLAATEEPNYIEMSVQDSGVGIPQEMIGKLFSKFEQVKSGSDLSRKHKGTGLGLTIAKGIVEAHGGKIRIESPGPSGKGTAFFFTLPKLTDQLKERLKSV